MSSSDSDDDIGIPTGIRTGKPVVSTLHDEPQPEKPKVTLKKGGAKPRAAAGTTKNMELIPGTVVVATDLKNAAEHNGMTGTRSFNSCSRC